MGGTPNLTNIGQNFGLDAAFGVMQGMNTPGDLGDKIIAGTTSAVGGGLGGIAATTMIPGGMGKLRWLTEIGGGYAGDMAGQAVGDVAMRLKSKDGMTPWERLQTEGDAEYRAQLERETLAKYGLGGYQPTDLFLESEGWPDAVPSDVPDFLLRFRRQDGEGRDAVKPFNRAMDLQDSDYKSNRGEVMLGSNQTFTTARDAMGVSDPTHKRTREKMGMGLSDDPVRRAGEVVGVIGSDLVEDRTRELWWLLNAAQAVGTVSLEAALKKHAPDLYKKDELYMTKDGDLTKEHLEGTPIKSDKDAMITGLAYQDENQQVRPKKHISKTKGGQWQIARHQPGHISMLNVPIGFAINSGIGLMNPFGGQEGYKAVFESDDDPSKTSNVIGEIGAKIHSW